MSDAALDASVDHPRTTGTLKRAMKRLVFLGLLCAAVFGVCWYGHDWWTNGRFVESTDDAYVGGDTTAISPHVAGFITQVAVTDNAHVQAGQILIRLDDRDVRAAADRAKAVWTEREAALATLEARAVLQQAMIRQASADLDAKAAQATFAQADSGRYTSLANTAAVTRQEAERSLSVDKAARADVLSAQAGFDAARQQLAVLDAQTAEAKAAAAQAAADVTMAKLNLGYTEIRSPIDGFVGNRAARDGAYVSAGAYLLTIVPAHGLWIDANFKEDQLKHMEPGATATVIADVMPDHVLHGHVLSMAPGTGAVFSVIPPENATGNFTKIVQRVPVRIALDDDDAALGQLRPGLSTSVSVDTRTGASR